MSDYEDYGQIVRWAILKDSKGEVVRKKLQVLVGNQEWQDVKEVEMFPSNNISNNISVIAKEASIEASSAT